MGELEFSEQEAISSLTTKECLQIGDAVLALGWEVNMLMYHLD